MKKSDEEKIREAWDKEHHETGEETELRKMQCVHNYVETPSSYVSGMKTCTKCGKILG